MAWGKYDGTTFSTSSYTMHMQRFALPSSLSIAPTPLHDPVGVPATPSSVFQEVGLVYTSATTMLAVWTDIRSNSSEVYAAPIDLGACP